MPKKTNNQYITELQDYILHNIFKVPENTHRSLHAQYLHHIDRDTLPMQGWKIHVSVKDYEDYDRVLHTLVPNLEKYGFQYKLINPQFLYSQLDSDQKGKAITIYLKPGDDLEKLFSRNPLSPTTTLLKESAVDIPHEQKIAGRAFARYGSFRGEMANAILNPSGTIQTDPRYDVVRPDFVDTEPTLKDISNFYSAAIARSYNTQNYKDFIEEALLGTHTWRCEQNPEWDSRRHNFVVITFAPEDYQKIKDIIGQVDRQFSGIFKTSTEQYGVIYKNHATQVLAALEEKGITYERPEWDKKYNVIAVDNKDLEYLSAALAEINSHFTAKGIQPIVTYTLGNNATAIMYDTTLDKELVDLCNFKQVEPYDICLGKGYDAIVQNWDRVVTAQVPAIEQAFYNRDHSHQINMGQTQELNQDMLNHIERERIR